MAVPRNRPDSVHNVSPRDFPPMSVSQVSNSSKVKHAGIYLELSLKKNRVKSKGINNTFQHNKILHSYLKGWISKICQTEKCLVCFKDECNTSRYIHQK